MDIQSISNKIQSTQLSAEMKTIIAQKATTPGHTSNPNQATRAPPTAEQLDKAVKAINNTISALSQNLEFTVDTEADRVVVKIIDQNTKEVLRQIPTEEALEISKSLDRLQGLLIKQQA